MPSTLNGTRSDTKNFCKCGLKSQYACRLLNNIDSSFIPLQCKRKRKIKNQIQLTLNPNQPMKEFINHPAVTRIFKTDIDVYGIQSIKLTDDDDCLITLSNSDDLEPSQELLADIKHAAITAKYEDEAYQDRYEDSDTIQSAIINRQK